MTEERDADWYRERLPDDLIDMLGDDPATTLLVTGKNRAVADGTIQVAPPADPELEKIVERAGTVIAKLTTKSGPIPLSKEDKAALDAVVLIVARPALFVRGGKVLHPPPHWPEVSADHALIEPNLQGIGCVIHGGDPGGTAVLVEERRALTNNHVVCWLLGWPPKDWRKWKTERERFTKEVDALNAKWMTNPAAAAEVDFLREQGAGATNRVQVKRVAGMHAKADVAVLELAAPPKNVRLVPLHPDAPKALADQKVYVVGYPMGDGPGTTPLFLIEKLFGAHKTLQTKRFSPGRLKGLLADQRISHDASTLGGSSGSAVFDFETHEMIAIHHAGSYSAKNNYAYPMWQLVEDALMKDNLIGFSGE